MHDIRAMFRGEPGLQDDGQRCALLLSDRAFEILRDPLNHWVAMGFTYLNTHPIVGAGGSR